MIRLKYSDQKDFLYRKYLSHQEANENLSEMDFYNLYEPLL